MVDMAAVAQLAIAIILPVAGGFVGGMATASEIKTWYSKLKKPSWNPPNWLFGPVWTVLYICMGVASWLVYRKGGWAAQGEALTFYVVQLLLNFAWTPIFFAYHRVDYALVEIVVMLAFEVMTVVKFSDVIGTGVTLALMGPYMAWTSFATFLTYTILRLNPQLNSWAGGSSAYQQLPQESH